MKRRKAETETVKPLTTEAVEECADAMRIATEVKQQMDAVHNCISCGGVFTKSSMILVGTRDGVGAGIFGLMCVVDVDVSLCKACAQSEDNISRCIQYPLPERRTAERRGQPSGDPPRDNAYAAVAKTRVSKEQLDAD